MKNVNKKATAFNEKKLAGIIAKYTDKFNDNITNRSISDISLVNMPLKLDYLSDFEYNDLKLELSCIINSYGNINYQQGALVIFPKGVISRNYGIKSILRNEKNNIFDNTHYYLNSPEIALLTMRCNNRKYISRKRNE